MLEAAGFYENCIVVDSTIAAAQRPRLKRFSGEMLNEAKVAKLEQSIRDYQAMGITVILVELPVNELYSFFEAEFLEDYHREVKRVVEETKVGFIPLADAPELTGEHYRNLDHVNCHGAVLYTRFLNQRLQEMLL